MSWHDQTPWRRKHRQAIETPEQRLDEIEKRVRSGDIGIRDAIDAACAVGKAYEQARLIPGANQVQEQT